METGQKGKCGMSDTILRGEFKSGRVWIDGRELTPQESLKVFNHSPTGFMWSYGGSGPAQLALAILLELSGDKDWALEWCQDFKWQVIARIPPGDFEMRMPLKWMTKIAEGKTRNA